MDKYQKNLIDSILESGVTVDHQMKIAGKIYKCKNTAKRFFGDEYEAKIKPYKNLIEAHQKKFGFDVLPSVLELCSFESVRDNEMATMLFMAAAAEMICRFE